ncbi:MAG TPA: ribonuclease HII [Syntrophales bacterium]|jgi:ribonuclease HII|nr:ribonuclease HII [Syntrophales bacterium]HOX94304.1 ribonuclease HII [Syntrophales bacterium]HPI58390.1 ribonuclease HII [Syntrophales bacterium]HPN26064.1 ribonuclease HII [Syntrophales bacterium]HQM30401.1 ribonuclease HII [Syntrophales bacterium]
MDSFETEAYRRGFTVIAGIDEAGRGPLAGPVVAAAVVLPRGYKNGAVRDSKKLTPRSRDVLYEVITRDALSIGLGVTEPSVIDRVNILQATLMAMREAVTGLSLQPDYLLVDGLHRIDLPLEQRTIIRGDDLSLSVACASIIAKVSRDRIMEIYHHQFPQYNFLRNRGYGTREHVEAIGRHGLCKIHRRSFKISKGALDEGKD